ncbi:MAG TPA: glycogen debranching N-terminal domain-containing protein, partial [Ktedonobacterales bacterium]|nr:glycogen debranching N-terminal domain-containing protein [Ktedonobacterales bacterium]
MRFLRACDLFLEGAPLMTLSHSISDEEGSCEIDLTNPYLRLAPDQSTQAAAAAAEVASIMAPETPGIEIQQGTIHVRRVLIIRGRQLVEALSVTNYSSEPLGVLLALKLSADFADIFEIRGMSRPKRGELAPPQLAIEGATFSYRGLDEIERVSQATFIPTATATTASAAFWRLSLLPGATHPITITVQLSEYASSNRSARRSADDIQLESWTKTSAPKIAETLTPEGAMIRTIRQDGQASVPLLHIPSILSDNVFFNRLLTRGLHDLVMMCTQTPDGLYPYGGIPWYVCPFGRDALITSIEFLPWFPGVARGTLAFLAAHQGEKEDPFTEEEPGRIFHEFRQGEMANCQEIPFIPYYGSVDATPLFLIALEKYLHWTNDTSFLAQLWPHAEAAARWLTTYGDKDGDGFIEYQRISDKGLINQGWKDSWDAISHEDGRYAEAPIALCEAQGYAYAAYLAMATLTRRMGKPQKEARAWEQRAATLQTNFVRQFWWKEEQVFYLALDRTKQPCRVVSSNAGQCLWTGITPAGLAEGLIERLMQDDMYTGWGIRTLSSHAARFNPMSYHNGSVWPHDVALIGLGCARYGRKDVASKLLGNLYGASLYFE